jgi:bifunctional non-homologous end joining protein LigD
MMVDDLAGLVACGQLGALELHTWGAHADKPERPDLLVFDLDPDPTVGWDDVVAAAVDVRDKLAAIGLESWVKTTGGKGLHVCAPVTRLLGWDDTKAFTKAFAEHVASAAPERYTTNLAKAARRGRIFVDYLRNGRGATFIAPYSMRRRPGAPVATPVTWAELERGVDPAAFTVVTVPQRLGALGEDPWHGISRAKQSITAAARRAVGAR